MTPAEFKDARTKLGLSAEKMARVLGLAEGRVIRRHEAGDRGISGPLARLVQILADDRCPPWVRELCAPE